MRTALITVDAPDAFLTLDEAKAHLRIESDDDDTLIQAMTDAVCGLLDGPDGVLKSALGEQTLELVLPTFHALHHGQHRDFGLRSGAFAHLPHVSRIELPLPPAIEVTEITYFDGNNAEQTLDASAYSLIDCGSSPSFLIPVPGTAWPSTYPRPDAVSITFTAGGAAVPAPILAAAKLMLGDLYANRESVVYTAGAALQNPTVNALLAPRRILRF